MDAPHSLQTAFKPLPHAPDGYLPIEYHGLIGDGAGAALVGHDGTIAWLCVPRFDSPPIFCALLDARRGGAFTIAPERLADSRQHYLLDSGVLRVTDAMTFRRGAELGEGVRAARRTAA